jgi:hypothetical protein
MQSVTCAKYRRKEPAHLPVRVTCIKESDKLFWCEASVRLLCEQAAVMNTDNASEILELSLVIFPDKGRLSQND